MCHARVYAGVNMLQEMDQLNRSTKYVHISRPGEYIKWNVQRWKHVASCGITRQTLFRYYKFRVLKSFDITVDLGTDA